MSFKCFVLSDQLRALNGLLQITQRFFFVFQSILMLSSYTSFLHFAFHSSRPIAHVEKPGEDQSPRQPGVPGTPLTRVTFTKAQKTNNTKNKPRVNLLHSKCNVSWYSLLVFTIVILVKA